MHAKYKNDRIDNLRSYSRAAELPLVFYLVLLSGIHSAGYEFSAPTRAGENVDIYTVIIIPILKIFCFNLKIAEGGYAFVYRACDSQRRRYAVKKLIIQSFESEVAARKEVECLRRYRHHSIVDLIDSVVKDDGSGSGKFYFLLFPYMKNGR